MCTKCKEWKVMTKFSPDRRRPDGKGSSCVRCQSKYKAEWRRNKGTALYKAQVARRARKIKTRFGQMKHEAARKKVPCTLTIEQYEELLSRPCAYCGVPLNKTGIGLDQKIPGLGYTWENVVPCCGRCNEAKGQHITYAEMKYVIGPRLRREDEENRRAQEVYLDLCALGHVGPLRCPGTRDLFARLAWHRGVFADRRHLFRTDLDPD